MIINKLDIREQNEATVLKAIIENKNISRANISTLTKLNKASVSQIIKNLIENDIVEEVGIGDASSMGGRKPIQLHFNGRCGLALAFDVGYNYVAGMLAYLDGEVIRLEERKNTPINSENILPTVQSIITNFLSQAPVTPHGLVGISLAIHGIVNDNRITFTPYYNLSGLDIKEPLEQLFSVPVFVENEANLNAVGEYCFMTTGDYQKIISLSIHSGIGAGTVANGSLQSGSHGFSGELGHSTLFPNGKSCPCGNKGCLEQYASNRVLFDTFTKLKDLDFVNSDIFAAAYNAGDVDAIRLALENVDYLSIGLNNIIVAEDPELLIVNSSVYRKIPDLLPRIRRKMVSRFTQSITIQTSLLGDHAPLYGGIAQATSHFLKIQNLRLGMLKK